MPRLTQAVPKYRHHKASGQAIVSIAGQDYYLGLRQSRASKLQYDRVIGEWLARGRQPQIQVSGLTNIELLARYWRFARSYYVKRGQPTGELSNIRYALRPLKSLYGSTLAEDFGPLRLKAVRQKLIENGLSEPWAAATIFWSFRAMTRGTCG